MSRRGGHRAGGATPPRIRKASDRAAIRSTESGESQKRSGEARSPAPTRREIKAQTQEVLATGVQTLQVDPDEAGMRVDRFLVARFPQLAFTHIQRIVRKGELRVDGKRAKPQERLEAGQKVRIPPLRAATRTNVRS
jgi:23S rRNA pseudouridine955/2504/2580 synthase